MNMEQMIKAMERSGIDVQIGGAAKTAVGGTRFGGQPDVPADFVWPMFTTDTYEDDEVKARPLTFLAQFDCAELAALDKDDLLPETGVLSFFYEMGSQRWGFDPKDAGCARVYWFDDAAALAPAEFPDDLAEENRFPALNIALAQKAYLPDWADFESGREQDLGERYDEFYEERAMMEGERPDVSSKLLGWPDIIQNNMTAECELVSRGHYLGGTWENIPQQDKDEALQNSLEQWQLLFQLDMVNEGDFSLMFGDSGRLYFYIRREDLRKMKFDRVWVILQCY